jgi:hypothetical protein
LTGNKGMSKKLEYFLFFLAIASPGCGDRAVLVFGDTACLEDAFEGHFEDTREEASCRSDEDCSNGLFCDGEEKCLDGLCVAGDPVACDDGNDCTIDSCDEEAGACVFVPRDADGDGFGDAACGGTDCDDGRADVYPGAPESCEEGDDLDCSGTPDLDNDDDGYIDINCPGGDDCDDNDPDTYPGAPEVCLDGVDEDCDGIADGPMLMESNIKIANDSFISISVVWTGSEFGIVWDRDGIYFTRVSAEGVEIGNEQLLTTTACYGPSLCYHSNYPSMVWTGSEFVIAYRANRVRDLSDIYFIRLTSHGININGETRLTYTNEQNYFELEPSIAWTGSLLGLAWEDHPSGIAYGYIYFKEFDLSGVDANEQIILNEYENGANPQLAWTGSEFGIIWDCRGICFSRVSSEGEAIGEIIQLTTLDHLGTFIPAPVWNGSEFCLAWHDNRIDGNLYQVYFMCFSPEGEKETADIMLSNPDNFDSEDPSLVWTGSESGIVWLSTRECCGNTEPFLYFNHLGPDGSKLGDDIELSGTYRSDYSNIVDLTWTGSEFGVVWLWVTDDSGEGIYFNRIGYCD